MFQNKKTLIICSFAAFLSISICGTATAKAHEVQALPDGHAPIGVMGDHKHNQGEWMLSYRYGRMSMHGARKGSSRIGTGEILNDFMMAPRKMTMEMHMFGAMYGVSDRLTVMGMLPYVKKSMEMVTSAGVRFSTESEGIGDGRIGGIYALRERGSRNEGDGRKEQLLFNFGVVLPTGSVRERADTPMGANRKLAYGMQTGGGTFNPSAGLTYTLWKDGWSWGGQMNTVQPLGRNSEGYRHGARYMATGWVARNFSDEISLSLRLEGTMRRNIKGRDSELNPAMAPGARTDLQSSRRLEALAGLNYYRQQGYFAGNRLAVEFGIPLYENLTGPQMSQEWRSVLGWQLSF